MFRTAPPLSVYLIFRFRIDREVVGIVDVVIVAEAIDLAPLDEDQSAAHRAAAQVPAALSLGDGREPAESGSALRPAIGSADEMGVTRAMGG